MGSLNLVASPSGSDALDPWVDVSQVVEAVPGLSSEQAQVAVQTATDVLYALSGRRYPGVRSSVLRLSPTIVGGGRELLPDALPWSSVVGRRRSSGCCGSVLDPMLYPIVSVERVTVGGVDVDPSQIDASNGRTIRIVRGTVVDPLAVNYYAGPDGAYSLFPGSCGCAGPAVEVALTWGLEAPAGGVQSALMLAQEFAKAMLGEQCRLPGNVVSVNRQGVSIVLDPTALLDSGRVGIPFVDTWLASVNPAKLRQPSLLWSPEMPLPEVVG